MIGTYGPVTFVASDSLLRTITQMQRQRGARYARHDLIGAKPLIEFTGDDLDEISFQMRFDVAHGVNPRREMEVLGSIKAAGESHPLVVAGQPVGIFVLTSLAEDWRQMDGQGRLLVGSADVQMLEDAS